MSEFTVFWVGAAGNRGILDGGDFDTRDEAAASLPEFLQDMLGQCADEEQREGILSGTFAISTGDSRETIPVSDIAA